MVCSASISDGDGQNDEPSRTAKMRAARRKEMSAITIVLATDVHVAMRDLLALTLPGPIGRSGARSAASDMSTLTDRHENVNV